MLRIHVLGGVRAAASEEAPAPLLPIRAVEILVVLALQADRPVARSQLAGILWPESTEAQARTNLRRELHSLRQIPGLNDAVLALGGGSLVWRNVASCWLDLREFEVQRAAAVAASGEAGTNPAGTNAGTAPDGSVLESAARAVAAYGGDLLPGLYDDWILEQRSLLRRECVDLCDLGAAAVSPEDVQHHGTAINLARRRVQLEPLEEVGYQILMRLLTASGDRGAAVTVYHRCASVLAQELGAEPDPRTRELVNQLLRPRSAHEPGHDPGGPSAEPDGAVHAATVVATRERNPAGAALVGREREVGVLTSSWRAAVDGRPGIVLVTGEAGVGKSRLVAELAAHVRLNSGISASARCFAGPGRIALAPIATWLRTSELRSILDLNAMVWNEEVGRLLGLPVKSPAPRGPGPSPPETDQPVNAVIDAWQRHRLFDGLAQAVLASGRPTLLVLDDLQWCDEETLGWLGFVLARGGPTPLLVAATARSDELTAGSGAGPALRAYRAAGWLTEIELAPLDLPSTTELAASVTGGPLTADQLRLLHGASGGYPLYVLEAARALTGSGDPLSLSGRNGFAVMLRSRLAESSPEAGEVAALASAVGREFRLDLLVAASDQDERTTVRAVDELWRRGIVREQSGGYDFSHDLLRAATYDGISPPRRWLFHHRIAQSLERLHAADTDVVAAQLAEQFRLGHAPERALAYFERAGDLSTRLLANAQALSDYQQCLDLLAESTPPEQRYERELGILRKMAAPLTALRGYAHPQLRSTLERIVELAGRLEQHDVLLAGLIGLFAATFVQGDTALSFRIGARSLKLAASFPNLEGQAHFAYAGAAVSLGRPLEAIQHFEQACALSPDSFSYILGTRIEVHARAWSAHAYWLVGEGAKATAAAAEAVGRARMSHHPYSLAVAIAYAAVLHQIQFGERGPLPPGRREALFAEATELRQLCERYDFEYYGHWGLILSGWATGGPGGLTAVREGIGKLRASGSFARMPYWLSLQADLEPDPVAKRAILTTAEAASYQRDDLWWLPEVLRLRATTESPSVATSLRNRAGRLALDQESSALAERIRAGNTVPDDERFAVPSDGDTERSANA